MKQEPFSAGWAGYMWAALAATLGTLLLAPWQQAVTPAGAALLYALAAVVLAISYGTGPAVLAALVGGVAYHVIFAADADRREWMVPGVLLLIALSAGQVTTRLRRHAELLRRQSRERAELSEQMRAAELKHAAEALRSSILAALSHDLRTPLTALVSQAETLQMGRLPPERQAALLETLRQQALALSRQMNNLLDMARLASGAVELKRAWQPIEEIVGVTLQQARSQWPQRQFAIQIAAELPPVNIDAVLLERALWNLLDNAAKYSPPDQPVTVDVSRTGCELLLAVCDAGQGIDPADAARLFTAFQRGQTESDIAGTGLGLSIAQSIARAHGGSIEATRPAAGGSCVVLRLPLGEAPACMPGMEAG